MLKFIVFYVGFAKEDLYSMSRRTKGEGTIRKRSDGRLEGRYTNCIGEVKSVYGKSKTQTYIENILRHARAMFKFAAEEGVIAKSPFLYVKKKCQLKKVRRNLTVNEIKHLLEVSKSMDYPMYIMICTMLYINIRLHKLTNMCL